MKNLICTFELKKNQYKYDSCEGILTDTAFAVKITYQTMFQATPGQLIIGFYMTLNTRFISEWRAIRKLQKKLIDKNIQLGNKNHKPHTYIMRDKVFCV